MRTTLTIDNDVAAALRQRAHDSGRTFKSVVNETLRTGLTTGAKPPPDRPPFRVPSARRGFMPGIDPLKLNQLFDDLETDAFLEERHGPADV